MIRFGAVIRRSSRAAAVLTILAFFGFLASKAHAIPLSEFFDEDEPATITAGNLLFSDWTLISNDAETDLSQIDVTAVVDRPFGPGIRFTDTGGVLVAEMPEQSETPDDEEFPIGPPALANTISSDFFDIAFQYTVTGLDLGLQLAEASLELVDFAINGTGNVDIDEGLEGDQASADLNVFAIGIPIPVESFLLDSESFGPEQSLLVTTNLFGVVEGPGDLAQITSFEQLFTPIPEPASLSLFAGGLLGLGLFRMISRRRRVA